MSPESLIEHSQVGHRGPKLSQPQTFASNPQCHYEVHTITLSLPIHTLLLFMEGFRLWVLIRLSREILQSKQRKALRQEAWIKAALGVTGFGNEERHEGSQRNMAVKLVEDSRDHQASSWEPVHGGALLARPCG